MPPEYFFPLLGLAFAAFFGVMGTVKWYLREQLRARHTVGAGEDPGRVAALEARVMELEERVDFAERLLARGDEAGQGR